MDYDLWMKFADRYSFEFINSPLAALRVYDEAKTFQNMKKGFAEKALVNARSGAWEKAMSDIEGKLEELEKINRTFEELNDNYFVRLARKVGLLRPAKSLD